MEKTYFLFGSQQSLQLAPRLYGNFALARGSGYAFKFRPQLNFLFAEQTIAFQPPPRDGLPPPPPITLEEFGLLNTQLSIPISYTSSSWDIELGWNINFPNQIIRVERNLNSTNFFSLTLGYLFDLSGN